MIDWIVLAALLALAAYTVWRCYRLEERVLRLEEFVETIAPDWELIDSFQFGPEGKKQPPKEPPAPQVPRLRSITRKPQADA